MDLKRKSAISIIVYCAVIGVCLIAALYVCAHKSGFHEDEYYTYYSSNRTAGFWVEDSELMDRQTILDEFSVVPGEGFNFGLVKEVQSWDVHPPIYYFVVHAICSVNPGVFSKWQGLLINLVCFGLSLCLVIILAGKLLGDETDWYLPAVLALVVGLSAATLTAVAFIRMYMLLTVWVLAVTILHVNYLRDETKRKNIFYIKLALLTFLGFMTHYYFFIWLFFLAVSVNLYELITTRKWTAVLKYAATMIVTFGLCYAFYPAWPAQMFKGQRGAQATGNFFDISNTIERISFFAGKVNRIGFGGILWLLILLAVGCAIVVFVQNKKVTGEKTSETGVHISILGICIILIISSVCYFLTVSKTALMLGDSSIRYQMPVLGVTTVALVIIIVELLKRVGDRGAKLGTIITGMVMAIMIICNVVTCFRGGISFLYPEEKDHAGMIEDCDNAGIIYIYNENPAQIWCIWDSTDEFLKFDKVLFLSADSDAELTADAKGYIESHDTLLVYVDDSVDAQKVINRANGELDGLSTKEADFSHEFCDIYILK